MGGDTDTGVGVVSPPQALDSRVRFGDQVDQSGVTGVNRLLKRGIRQFAEGTVPQPRKLAGGHQVGVHRSSPNLPVVWGGGGDPRCRVQLALSVSAAWTSSMAG